MKLLKKEHMKPDIKDVYEQLVDKIGSEDAVNALLEQRAKEFGDAVTLDSIYLLVGSENEIRPVQWKPTRAEALAELPITTIDACIQSIEERRKPNQDPLDQWKGFYANIKGTIYATTDLQKGQTEKRFRRFNIDDGTNHVTVTMWDRKAKKYTIAVIDRATVTIENIRFSLRQDPQPGQRDWQAKFSDKTFIHVQKQTKLSESE